MFPSGSTRPPGKRRAGANARPESGRTCANHRASFTNPYLLSSDKPMRNVSQFRHRVREPHAHPTPCRLHTGWDARCVDAGAGDSMMDRNEPVHIVDVEIFMAVGLYTENGCITRLRLGMSFLWRVFACRALRRV